MSAPHPTPSPIVDQSHIVDQTHFENRIKHLESQNQALQDQLSVLDGKAEYGYYWKHDLELFERHARNNTVWLISTNKAMLPLAYNLLCAIARFNPALIDQIIFHAVDYEAKLGLELHRWQHHWNFNKSSPYMPTYGSNSGYGILYNPLFSGTSKPTHWGEPEYWRMMKQRPSFFLTLLRAAKLNVLFSDTDILYFTDPLKFVIDPTQAGEADFAISTDARNMFTLLNDSRYMDSWRKIPSFCGGFFFARSNARTISFFERLERFLEADPPSNDQFGFERMMDESPVRLVGRLPRGLSSKPGVNADVLASNRAILPPVVRSKDGVKGDDTTISVHILDQWQFLNGAVYENYGRDKWEAEAAAVAKDPSTGEFDIPVFKHANFPGYEKLDKMKRYGWWLLAEDNESCPILSSQQ